MCNKKITDISLYQIEQSFFDTYSKIEELLLNQEATEEQLKDLENSLNICENNLIEKSLNITKYLGKLDNETDYIDREIKRLQDLKKTKTNVKERIKTLLSNTLISLNKEKLDLGLYKISFRESTKVEIKENTVLPNDFTRTVVTVEPDKNKLKEALKRGLEIEGVSIVSNKNIQIK